MPALPDVNKVLRVRVIGTDANDASLGTRFFIQYSGGAPSASELNTFAQAVASAWNSDLAALSHSDYTLTEVQVEDLTSPTAFTGSYAASLSGSRSGTALPLSNCVSVQYQTGLRRRGGKWRGQWRFGVAGDLQNTQTWTTTFISDVLSDFASFMSAVVGSGWSGAGVLEHVGVNYYKGFTVVTSDITGRARNVPTLLTTPEVYAVTGYDSYTRVGSMRRRLGKSGT